MSDKVYVGQKMQTFQKGEPYAPVSRVTFWVDDEHFYTAGDDTGRTLEAENPWATQEMVNNVYEQMKGFVYRPFEATGVDIDPAFELGDAVTIGGIYTFIGQATQHFDAMGSTDISLPGEKEIDHEYPYKSPQDRELKRRVKLGQKYQGVRIDRRDGLTITETDGETEGAKVVLNSKELSFYDAVNNRVLFFDPTSGTYRFTGEMNVNNKFIVTKDGNVTIDGSLTMGGNSNWLLTRYSTDKNASVPSKWQEAWDAAWDNTSTQVWVIYSYNGGKDWTQPMLVQGKDGAQGATGPQGSSANIPDWVKAYTASAEFNTKVTDEWVLTMNLLSSKIFGGAYYDLGGNAKLSLEANDSKSYADLIFQRGDSGKELFKLYDGITYLAMFLLGERVMEYGLASGSTTAYGNWKFENPPEGVYARFA